MFMSTSGFLDSLQYMKTHEDVFDDANSTKATILTRYLYVESFHIFVLLILIRNPVVQIKFTFSLQNMYKAMSY